MSLKITIIILFAVFAGFSIYAMVNLFLFNRRMAKYAIFKAELEAKEREWERIRLG